MAAISAPFVKYTNPSPKAEIQRSDRFTLDFDGDVEIPPLLVGITPIKTLGHFLPQVDHGFFLKETTDVCAWNIFSFLGSVLFFC